MSEVAPVDRRELLQRADTSSFDTAFAGRVSFGSSWEKRRQTLAVFTCSLYFIIPLIPICWYWTVIYMLFPFTTIPTLMYIGYVFLLDSSPTSGKYWPWIRSWKWWDHACDYFPILLVKTAHLSPDKSYVLGYHPHGIISVGALGAFATNGARTMDLSNPRADEDFVNRPRGFSNLFPGIDRRLITLPVNFSTPVLREYILGMGCCNSDRNTFRTVLSRNYGKANALVVVVGGAAESMLVKPGSIQLVLEKRRGFVREAIRARACLVPTLAFGETDLYHVIQDDETHWVKSVQSLVRKMTGVAMPLFRGRSIFFRDFGVMPHRKPIVVVVGSPIEPPDLPDNEVFDPLIDKATHEPLNEHGKLLVEWHDKYKKALKDLYEKYKDKSWNEPGQSRKASLVIVQ